MVTGDLDANRIAPQLATRRRFALPYVSHAASSIIRSNCPFATVESPRLLVLIPIAEELSTISS
jgi:hypothetical protein